MKSKLWNGGFLRTVLQGLTVTCAALLALSALGGGADARRGDRPAAAFGGRCGDQLSRRFSRRLADGTACRRAETAGGHRGRRVLSGGLYAGPAAVLRQSGGADPARDACDACCGGSGRDRREHAAKACPAQKKMKAFLHASKSKLYLHFMHQRAGLPSFQDFDFTHEFQHYMLCFFEKYG